MKLLNMLSLDREDPPARLGKKVVPLTQPRRKHIVAVGQGVFLNKDSGKMYTGRTDQTTMEAQYAHLQKEAAEMWEETLAERRDQWEGYFDPEVAAAEWHKPDKSHKACVALINRNKMFQHEYLCDFSAIEKRVIGHLAEDVDKQLKQYKRRESPKRSVAMSATHAANYGVSGAVGDDPELDVYARAYMRRIKP